MAVDGRPSLMDDLEILDVGVRRAGRSILAGVCLRLAPGDRLAIVGANGAGKTTLLKVALGRLAPDVGSVRIGGRDIRAFTPRQRAERLAWLPQHDAVAEPIAAVDLVATARYRFGEPWSRSVREANRVLAKVGGGGLARRPFPSLSGGERQQVALAALLAQDAPLLFLDEPGNHLDPVRRDEVFSFVGALVGGAGRPKRGVCVVTHDLFALSALGPPDAVRVVGLDRGRVAFETTVADEGLAASLSGIFGRRLVTADVAGRRVFVPDPRVAAGPKAKNGRS